jgi:hypothetical protein
VTIGALLTEAEGDEVATLRDHLAGQDGDAAALFSRGAKIGKRSGESEAKEEIAFVPVRVEEPARSNSGPRCRFRHTGGHELEFGELPEVVWLAALFNALSSSNR